MLNEKDWDNIDEWVHAYSKAYVHGDSLPELEGKLKDACNGLVEHTPQFDDFVSILDTSIRSRDAIARKVAWTAQRATGARAWCVGAKLIHGKFATNSPVIDQVAALDVEPRPVNLQHIKEQFIEHYYFNVQGTVDAVLIDVKKNTLMPVKGVAFSQAQRRSRALAYAKAGSGLFGQGSSRLLCNLIARQEELGALVVAHALLKSAFPHMEVVPGYIVVDDLDAGWHFELLDMTELVMRELVNGPLELDDYPVLANSLEEVYGLRADSNAIAHLPIGVGDDPLEFAPVDRPTRCLMFLNELWRQQKRTLNEFVPVKATELAALVEHRYKVVLPPNTRRHDLEDGLQRRGFIERCRYSSNSYGLTPVGVFRIYAMKRLFLQRSTPDVGAIALQHIQHQARLLNDYRR